MKRIGVLLLVAMLVLTTACSGIAELAPPVGVPETGSAAATIAPKAAEIVSTPLAVEYDSADLEAAVSVAGAAAIRLNGDSIAVEGSGVTVAGTVATISSAGTYTLQGVLSDGQIIVDTQDEEKVQLILSGVDIACSTSAPIYILNAPDKVVITLAEGTENTVTDGEQGGSADAGSDDPNAAIFSHDDLTINGTGSLIVNATYNNGIVSKDDLKITGGNITVTASNDGIKGRNSIAVKAGTLVVSAGADGLQSNNDENAEEGYILIEGGTIRITSGLDGIQAETKLLISGGDLSITSGGGSVNSSDRTGWGDRRIQNDSDTGSSTASAKGLKAGADVSITGGTIYIDSSDDSVHSNGSLSVSGGELLLTSGDDGMHSDATLDISGGNLTIAKSYEGIESALITINAGTIRVVSSDDAINAAGGVDGSSVDGRPGQNQFMESGDCYLVVNGGTIFVDAVGDGLDINGAIVMTEGVVIVNGPTSNANGALDYLGSFEISGGLLVAVGSAGMAMGPSSSSTQYSVMFNLASSQPAETLIHIEAESGEDILTFLPTRQVQSVVVSTPALVNGATYTIFVGGSSTGTVSDGLYAGGVYTPGTHLGAITASSGMSGGGGPGGFPGGNRRPGGGTRP